MVKIKFSNEKLKEISAQARAEDRTVLGIIYSEHIEIHFPLIEILNPKNVYCSAKFISKLLNLDKEIIGEKARDIYFQYAPSIFTFKTFTIEENEMVIVI